MYRDKKRHSVRGTDDQTVKIKALCTAVIVPLLDKGQTLTAMCCICVG